MGNPLIRMNPTHASQTPMKMGGGMKPPAQQIAAGVGGEHFTKPAYMKAGHNTSGHWIAGAIKRPGAEKRAAKKAGMSTHAYMEKNKGAPGKAGARARLGLRLEAMHRK